MRSCNTIEELWAAGKVQPTADPLDKGTMEEIVKFTIRRENKVIMTYFWTSFTYQMMVYALMSHLIVRYWGEVPIMVLSLTGILLYIPFTTLLMRKFKAMQRKSAGMEGGEVPDIYSNLKNKFNLLSGFFRFKQRFDRVAIPVSCFILIMVIFQLYVPGGAQAHPAAAAISYLSVLLLFITATRAENKKYFQNPLRQFETALKDI